MDSFINDKYTILDGTLLACHDMSPDLVIPSEAEGHPIRRIGAGLTANKKIRTVCFEEGIEEIGEKMFWYVETLEHIELPTTLKKCGEKILTTRFFERTGVKLILNRRFTPSEYEHIRANSILLESGSKLLAGDCYKLPAFADIIYGFDFVYPPTVISEDMCGLYIINTYEKSNIPIQCRFKGRRGLIRQNGHILKGQAFKDETASLLLREMPRVPKNAKSEISHDRSLATNILHSLPRVIMAYYKDSECTTDGDDIIIPFYLIAGEVYFADMRKVVYEGKAYYIYRENYLDCREKVPFLIVDYPKMVYDGNGRQVYSSIASNVIAKYNLLSLLT